MKLFVQADEYAIKFTVVMTIIADVAFIIAGIYEKNLYPNLVMAGGLTILVAVLWLVSRREGLLIEGDKLCYGVIKKKCYNINQFAELHIVKDQIHIGKFVNIDVKVKGNNKYKIIYMKECVVNDGEKGVLDFHLHHGKKLLFETVYDERVIEYFKEKGVPIIGNTKT